MATFCAILLLICLLLLALLLAKVPCDSSSVADQVNNTENTKTEIPKPRDIINSVNETCSYQHYRLPNTIKPHLYQAYLFPIITEKQATYAGNVTIFVHCLQSTQNIILHAAHFIIDSIVVVKTVHNQTLFSAVRVNDSLPQQWEECVSLQQINIPLLEAVSSGDSLSIRIHFRGNLRNNLDGFYLSAYSDSGKDWRMGTTQMQPYAARLSFPCFDEPSMKAVFQFNIIRDNSYFSLFNTQRLSSTPVGGNFTMDTFEKTEVMSTYLVAFVLCPSNYDFVEKMYNNITVRIYAPKSQLASANYALNVTIPILKHFEEFFGIPYTISKLDQIAIPDFAAGAMENWGLITYRPPYLLFDENQDSFKSKAIVTRVISHELAHQWFGNYVTMRWWNDIWLNEGFATYMESTGVEQVEKDINSFDDYIFALRVDGFVNTHPVALPENVTDADTLFDTVSYRKGATLLMMLESFMNLTNVKKGLTTYLNRYKYNNSESSDLWNVMTEVHREVWPESDIDVNEVMNTWSQQGNYPLIQVNVSSDGRSFSVSQERFLFFDGAVNLWNDPWPSVHNFLWHVPLKYITSNTNASTVVWLKKVKNAIFYLDEPVQWIKVNHGHRGYFLTNYDLNSWNIIIRTLEADEDMKVFSDQDAAGFLLDVQLLSSAGKVDLSVSLNILSILKNRGNFLVWKVGWTVINDFYLRLYPHEKLFKAFKMHVREIVTQTLKKVGFAWTTRAPDNSIDKLTHIHILRTGLLVNEPQCANFVMAEFQKILTNDSYIGNPDIYLIVLMYGVENSDAEVWETLWNRYNDAKDAPLSKSLRKALCSTENWRLIYRLLTYTLDSSKIRVMDIVQMFTSIAQNPVSSDIVWGFLLRYSHYFNEKLGDQKMLTADLTQSLANNFVSDYDYDKLKDFFESNPLGKSLVESQNQSLEKVQINIHWQKTSLAPIEAYYEKKYNWTKF